MPTKEEIIAYVQQGQVLPGWLVLRPKNSFLVRQAVTYGVITLIIVVLAVIFLGQNSFVIVPGYSSGALDHDAFQAWRVIDLLVLAIFFAAAAGMAVLRIIDLNTIQTQMLVLMPDGFFLKKRHTEQLVAYAGLMSMSAQVDRSGNLTLRMKAINANTLYKVRLDNRYGNARAIGAQVVSTQRQYVARQKASPMQA